MQFLAHLRCASVYQVTIKSASYGRPCGMRCGMRGMTMHRYFGLGTYCLIYK